MVKQSYSWATSTSSGPRPARRYSVSATCLAGSVVSDSRISTGNWMPGCGSGIAALGDGADERRRLGAGRPPARRS